MKELHSFNREFGAKTLSASAQTSQDEERYGCKDAEIVCFWNMETVMMQQGIM